MEAAASETRALDTQTREVLQAIFRQARAGSADGSEPGWSIAELEDYLTSLGLTRATYDAAVRGEEIDDEAASTLAAITVHGVRRPSKAKPDPDNIKVAVGPPDRAAILAHVSHLFGDLPASLNGVVEVGWTQGQPPHSLNHAVQLDAGDLDAIADKIVEVNSQQNQNAYTSGGLRRPETAPLKRAFDKDVSHLVALWADFDVEGAAEAAKLAFDAWGMPPTFVVQTMGTPFRKIHFWWKLEEPTEELERCGRLMKTIAKALGGDVSVTNASRPMRAGGTVAWPLKRGRQLQSTANLDEWATRRAPYSLDELARIIEANAPKPEPRPDTAQRGGTTARSKGGAFSRAINGGNSAYGEAALAEECEALARTAEGGGDRGGRNNALNITAVKIASLVAGGELEENYARECLWDAAVRCGHVADNGEEATRRTIESGWAHGLHSPRSAPPREAEERVYAAGVEPPPWGEEAAEEAAEEKAEADPAPDEEARPEEGESPGGDMGGGPETEARPQVIFDPWQRWLTPTFPLDTLPPVIRAFVEAQSTSTGADVSACAMASLAACSGALSHAFSLKMKRTGAWKVTPRLWVMLVGSSSAKKTPVINGALAPLKARDAAEAKAHAKEQARWLEAKAAGEKSAPPPPSLQFIANSTTAEMLGVTLSHQDRGLLVERDELAGWFGEMEKYGGGKGGAANRAFWLQAYNGGPLRIDTIARGKTFIENCSVSLLGGIQPSKLDELGDLSSDGMLQRFLPVMMRRAERPDEVDDTAASAAYGDLISYLTSVRPCQILMDDAALDVARNFQGFTYDMESVEGLGESFCSFLGKMNGVHGSLMLLLHMLRDPKEGPYSPVSARVAADAARILREFAIPHALALYQQSADGVDWDYLRSLASYVLTSSKDRFTVSDFTSGVHALRGLGVWEVGQKVSPLVAGGWLEDDGEARGIVKAWTVVPGVRNLMEERRQDEARRKAETMRAYRDLRG